MKKAFVALVLSPFIFAGSAGNYYQQQQQPGVDSISLIPLIQRKADSVAYVAADRIDSMCRKPINIILYQDLDRRPDGSAFIWEAWAQVIGRDTLYTHTVIYPL